LIFTDSKIEKAYINASATTNNSDSKD